MHLSRTTLPLANASLYRPLSSQSALPQDIKALSVKADGMELAVLLTSRRELISPIVAAAVPVAIPPVPTYRPIGDHSDISTGWSSATWIPELADQAEILREQKPLPDKRSGEIDPFYLAGCLAEWELREEPSAAWELLAAARSVRSDTRAYALSLISSSRHFQTVRSLPEPCGSDKGKRDTPTESNMNAPYGLEIADHCADCYHTKPGFFCGLSQSALDALDCVSHKSILPAGAILFVEGQAPRGMFVLCSGKVNLSTSSREGKIVTLRTIDAGETLGLSAAISNIGYETTAETATPCQVSFIERKHIVDLLQNPEVGIQVAQCLSRDFQSAYRDIHDLVLNRSSAGKLARLLLAQCPEDEEASEIRVHSTMTHEEMAQRIGASRETVTRLLSNLKRRKLIRADGPVLVIPSRSALAALAV